MNRRLLSIVGCAIGLIGVVSTVVVHHVLDRPPESPPGWEVELNLAERLRWRFGNLPAKPPRQVNPWREPLQLTAVAAGCAAIVAGVAGWIRREGFALGLLAVFLGAASIAWQQVLIVFALFIFAGGPMFWFDWYSYRRHKAGKAT